MLLFCICLLFLVVNAYDNGVGRLPIMGWNTWCTDDACGALDICTSREVQSVAQSIVNQGLNKLGYQYINLDDCWSAHNRTDDGQLQPDPDRFPDGMKALADFVHSLGLKLGLYTCVGTQTCRDGRPGSYGHYTQDAQTLAGWGIDFVKADNCNKPANETGQSLYTQYSNALNATGRPILFSLCNWGEENVNEWGATVGQMWRFQMDHIPFWDWPPMAAGEGYGQGTSNIIEYMATLNPSNISNHYGFMDPDFLETLFPAESQYHTMSFIDSKTEYAFWSLWSAPLLVATDVRNMSSDLAYIIANEEIIAIDQDELATPGDRVANYSNGGQVWWKPLSNGDKAILLYNSVLNIEATPINVSVTWDMVGWTKNSQVKLRDLWNKQDLGYFTEYSVTIKPHDDVYLRATLQSSES